MSPVRLVPFQALTAWLCCCEEVRTWHGNSAQGITDKHPDLNLVVSHWHSLPHGTGTFPTACRERTPHLYAAKPCFPCPTLCISMKKVKLEERRTLAEDEVQHEVMHMQNSTVEITTSATLQHVRLVTDQPSPSQRCDRLNEAVVNNCEELSAI